LGWLNETARAPAIMDAHTPPAQWPNNLSALCHKGYGPFTVHNRGQTPAEARTQNVVAVLPDVIQHGLVWCRLGRDDLAVRMVGIFLELVDGLLRHDHGGGHNRCCVEIRPPFRCELIVSNVRGPSTSVQPRHAYRSEGSP